MRDFDPSQWLVQSLDEEGEPVDHEMFLPKEKAKADKLASELRAKGYKRVIVVHPAKESQHASKENSAMNVEVANLEKMLSMEVEMAASWAKMNPKERQAYLKAHPLSKFRPGGAKKGPSDLSSHLERHGFSHQGRGLWKHANGRTLKVSSGAKGNTHAHHIQITHKNGDVSQRKTNSNKRAVSLITRMSKSPSRRK